MGDTANGSSNLNQYDGYVKIINGLLRCDNYYNLLQTLLLLMYNVDALYAIPVEVLDAEDMAIWVDFRVYTTALKKC
jgi:hypothetical protein